MRCRTFLITSALWIVPIASSAQVSVTSPAAGAASSYRNTVVSWDPIPGASSYRLEIDDDPNFGSPEVDVTVAGTSYALSGERLKLNGRLQWAAYVRLNGIRWNTGAFSRSYFHGRNPPAIAVDSQNRVYLGFTTAANIVQLTTSGDWSTTTRLSTDDTNNARMSLDLAVDENDVAHAFWIEHLFQWQVFVPYYTNSSTAWTLVQVPDPIEGGCAEGSIVVGGGQVDLFYAPCLGTIDRWISTDGVQFTPTAIPNNDLARSVSAARDAVGNLYVASDRYTTPSDDPHSSVQTSADGWTPHRFGAQGYPAVAVTSTGELHALRWGFEASEFNDLRAVYSNSRGGFETWTVLPALLPNFNWDIFPLVIDETQDRLHTALPGQEGIHLCSAANTAATSWTCTRLGNEYEIPGSDPALAVAPDGTVHVAWTEGINGVGYANSLGSFLATNFPTHLSLGTPSSGAAAVIVPTELFEADGDPVSGHMQVGRYEPVESHIAPGANGSIVHGRYTLENVSNNFIRVPGVTVSFQLAGSIHRYAELHRSALPPLPVMVMVSADGWAISVFVIQAWDDTGVTISQMDFRTYVALTYEGMLPATVDISALPEGELILGVVAWDGVTPVQRMRAFTKAPGQNQLVLTPPAPHP